MRFLATALLATTVDDVAASRQRPVEKRRVTRHGETPRRTERA
jgi:hypothetical protein